MRVGGFTFSRRSLYNIENLSDQSVLLLVQDVWDKDMSRHDFVDSGRIPLSDLEVGEVELELSFGTDVSFELKGPYED